MTVDKLLKALPSSVKVGPHTWKIKVVEDLTDENEQRIYGQSQGSTLTVTLKKDLPTPEFAVGVLIHELYHSALFSFGCSAPKKEEGQALFTEMAWVTIFRDNPWLLDWIKRGLK